MTLKRDLRPFAAKVKGQLTRVLDHDQLEALAHQTGLVQRSTRKLTGPDVVELMTIDMLDDAAVSLEGLGDRRRQRTPQATLMPPALHQRLLTPQAGT